MAREEPLDRRRIEERHVGVEEQDLRPALRHRTAGHRQGMAGPPLLLLLDEAKVLGAAEGRPDGVTLAADHDDDPARSERARQRDRVGDEGPTGHAVEHLSGYDLLHGEAVAVGVCVTAEIARILGACDDATVDAHYAICAKYGLPTRVPEAMAADDVLETIRYDKHYLGGLPQMALVSRVGEVWKESGTVAIPIDYAIIKRAIEANKGRLDTKASA